MNFEYMNVIMEFLNNELKEEKITSTTYLSKTYNINIAVEELQEIVKEAYKETNH